MVVFNFLMKNILFRQVQAQFVHNSSKIRAIHSGSGRRWKKNSPFGSNFSVLRPSLIFPESISCRGTERKKIHFYISISSIFETLCESPFYVLGRMNVDYSLPSLVLVPNPRCESSSSHFDQHHFIIIFPQSNTVLCLFYY